jgi:feruloyl esterase
MVQQRGYYPPFERGGEADGWPSTISPEPPPAPQTDDHAQIGIPFFEYFVFDDPSWEFRTFDWISGPATVDNKVVVPGQTLASVLNSVNPDLERFRARGGKLIQYHGFSDPEVPPMTSINNDPAQGVAFKRPLCVYPQEAVYKGSGNTDDAANFACE